ncbi:MAG: 30S ribosomal protein S8 [Candidatus Staskawiczbacteria bacterium CG10_big_fil_rev_8_21_14_0_10_38_10]|uniref:Small ribosomal subunit protein uS8 n=1 Tax=Candidatus Staskawiczbacteria bacterium CG10_big_fil_rev_8_21_14_0_10_38_10 TaxID=1974891 RepID=A0A2H9T226_9BACT|nr:MAG: 30S ribosomal protein S8 [Candidatus Staskawiczbacteria bacterium CG10_big_fil_rev_8_21_14_0_10_38_10]
MDPITDLLNQIRNAQAVSKTEIAIPLSKMKYEIAKILLSEGYISEVQKAKTDKKKILKIVLKYNNGMPAITGLKRVSKSGQRIYAKASAIKPIRRGYGISIISTSKGLMTNKKARKIKLGGEILCKIW